MEQDKGSLQLTLQRTMYTILKKRTVKTHKDVIYTGFLFIEEYYDVLLRFCRSKPVIPTYRMSSAEEILSDLVVERMPNWILHCRLVGTDEVKELCSVRRRVRRIEVKAGIAATNITATATTNISLVELTEYELTRVHDQMQRDLCSLIEKKNRVMQDRSGLPEELAAELAAINTAITEMNAAHEDYLEVKTFIELKKTEKKLLGYIYECIRRIKIKYLQTTKQTLAAKKTLDGFSLDIELAEDLKQNSLISNMSRGANKQAYAAGSTKENVAYGPTTELFEERISVLRDLLLQLSVSKDAVDVFLDLAIRSYTYDEVCRTYGLSRTNAARHYQSVAEAMQFKFTETELVKLLQDM